MNAQFHDEFVALTALYYSGEISEEEWALLQIHLAYCDSCHERFQQYQQITSDVIPAMAAVAASDLDNAAEESERSLDAAERRLMSRLDSLTAPQEFPSKRRFPRHTSAVLTAAGVAAIAHFLCRKRKPVKPRYADHASQNEGIALAIGVHDYRCR